MQVVGPILLAVQGEVVHDLRRAMLDEADGKVSHQQRMPTDDDQLGRRTPQLENMVEGETVSG